MDDGLSGSAPAPRRCGTCGETKAREQFNRKTSRADGLQEVCRDCNRAASRRYYQRHRERHLAIVRARSDAQKAAGIAYVAEHLLRHPCVDCGARDLRILDFDHRPATAKRDAVMQLVRNGFSIATIAEEIAKCDVRCRNCHAIVTYRRLGGDWRTRAMEAIGEDT